MYMVGKWFCPSILALLLVASVVSCSSNVSTSIKKTSKSSAAVPAKSSRYVRLQLEDLDVPESVSVTAVQRDGDATVAKSGYDRSAAGESSYPSDQECLPLTVDGDLSAICARSAAGFPNLFNHTDEKQSYAHFRNSAGRWRSVLQLSRSHRPSSSDDRDTSSVTAEVCRARLTAFVCSVYSPPCSPVSDMTADRFSSAVSCRKLCQLARDRCCSSRSHTPEACDWPADWNCHRLPADRMCGESSALTGRLWSFSDKRRKMAARGVEAMLQPGPPVATLPLPPRNPYDDPANPDLMEKRKHRLPSAWRRASRNVVSGSRKSQHNAVPRPSKSVH